MINDKVDVVIRGRSFTVEMEGLAPLSVNALANQVQEKIQDIEKRTKIPDTGKLAILAALEFAAELEKLRARLKDVSVVEDTKIDGMILALENSLKPDAP
jgi:cell division protein ZapA (FtsZ GTPase activity inhibitor)